MIFREFKNQKKKQTEVSSEQDESVSSSDQDLGLEINKKHAEKMDSLLSLFRAHLSNHDPSGGSSNNSSIDCIES